MNSKISGTIELYSGSYDMVDRKKYRYKTQRNEIIELWRKLYALDNKLYFLIIKPNDYA